jgi:hypothetical protein
VQGAANNLNLFNFSNSANIYTSSEEVTLNDLQMDYDEAGRINEFELYFFDGCAWYGFENGEDCPILKEKIDDNQIELFKSEPSSKLDWPTLT